MCVYNTYFVCPSTEGVELITLLFGYILGHILTVVKNVYLLGVNDFLSWIRSGVAGSY